MMRPRTLVVPTAGERPLLLHRCLLSFLRACQPYDQSFELVVAHNGSYAEEERTRGVLRELAREPGLDSVRFIGRAERRRYVEQLAAQLGGDEEVRAELVYALERVGSDGSNRNLLQLELVGDAYVSADDDTVALFSLVPEAELSDPFDECIDFDPTEFWFYGSREESFADASPHAVCPLWVFDSLLGRDVRIAQTGLVGDSGMEPSPYLLHHRGAATRARLLDDYALARACRYVRRGVARPTLAAGHMFMTTFCGFDGSDLLPPFLPLDRGADVLFAETLRATQLSLVGHVPLCVRHDPMPASPRAPMLSQLGVRATPAHLVSLALREWPRPKFTSGRARMRSLCAFLDDLVHDERAFASEFTALRFNYLSNALEAFELNVAGAEFGEDIDRARRAYADALRSAEVDVARAGTFISAFARLLAIWPDVDVAARRLRTAGIRPGVEEPPF